MTRNRVRYSGLVLLTLLLLLSLAGGAQQIEVTAPQQPVIRRTDPRDEPALVKIVEANGPGSMAALFSLGYLRDPLPRTRAVLRDAARSKEVLTAYPALCALWRIDDEQWKPLANAALPSLTQSQRMHIASLLFRAGDFTFWPAMRAQLLELLRAPKAHERLAADAFSIIGSAWDMRDEQGEGAALRDLRRAAKESPEVLAILDRFDIRTVPLPQ